jgi:hypothetical protein
MSLVFVSATIQPKSATAIANIKRRLSRLSIRFSSKVASGERQNWKALHVMWREYETERLQV